MRIRRKSCGLLLLLIILPAVARSAPEGEIRTSPSATAAPSAAPLAKKTADPARPYFVAAWTGVGMTLALLGSATVLGLLAQNRGDELGRITARVDGGQPPIFDVAERDAYNNLKNDGKSYDRAAIACFFMSGLTAVASGLLFWDAAKRTPKADKLAIVPVFLSASKSGLVSLVGSF